MNFLAILQSALVFLNPNWATQAVQNYEINRSNIKCYAFDTDNHSDNELDTFKPEPQIWCYHRGVSSQEPLFVFAAGDKKIKPELSFILDSQGFITHGSLHADVLSYSKVRAQDFNPFSVPLEEPVHQKPVPPPDFSSEQAEHVLNALALHQQKMNLLDASTMVLRAGEFKGSAEAAIKPWRGYWWPYKNKPLFGTATSPLGKYDKYVETHTGQISSARAWEASHHGVQRVWWQGHCNGWAASAILREQPSYSRQDPLSGLVFSVADQKGILAETDYCAVVAFFGNRYRGRPADDKRDIRPDVLHKALVYYIGQLHKPVVIDYRSGTPVDNHPVSAYTMNIEPTSETTFIVVTTLTFHKYDGKKDLAPGTAPAYKRVYKYTLTKNAEGKIVGGSWLSENPDFLWVPLGIGDCSRNNVFIDHDLVGEILNLPRAEESQELTSASSP